jgi:protein-S-isoprenylcysteine O-methyltransferase
MALPLTAILGLALFVSELSLARQRRSSRTAAAAQDKGSLRLLWIVIMAAIGTGLTCAGIGPRLSVLVPWREAGVGVFVLGAALRWWAIWHLGRFFTVDVALAADHQVVQDGPYRWVRHPSYTGLLLEFLGLALVPGAWSSLLIVMLPIVVALWYRIRVEEQALLDHLGEPYQSYMKLTRRLIPGVI